MKIGLFLGSFNPIHNGHLAIANYMIEFTDLDEIWLVVSPQNPLKHPDILLHDENRYKLVTIAIGNSKKIKASKIEFALPKPSYTINTLKYLHKKYPRHTFVLILGSDSLESFKKWKNWKEILDSSEIYVYSRANSDGGELKNHPKIKFVNGPFIEISSTLIRKAISDKTDVRSILPEAVCNYIEKFHFFEK